MATAFLASKGQSSQEHIVILMSDDDCGDRTIRVPQWAYHHIPTLLKLFNIKIIVSFGYTLEKVPTTDGVIYINLKDLYRKITGDTGHLNRANMGIDIRDYEPCFPKASALQTCSTYRAIYYKLIY